ncbi:MAG TPA: lasso peptide biosynthesis B2 protein [Vicinamibacterales bacterium]|nr:lasso peptide biosynthesis B2 protein [Vicinamibacterales bacterium]
MSRFLPTRHRWRVLEAMTALASVTLLLRILPFRTVMRLAASSAWPADDEPAPGRTTHPLATSVGAAVNRAAARLPWHSSCLRRALAGRFMLLRRGFPSSVVFGVAKRAGQIHAHAWLVAGGGIVCGGRDRAGFTPIAVLREQKPTDA